jgi:hypothetical protein
VKQWCVSKNFIANNDGPKRFAEGFFIKQKLGEREQDSGETKRERECVRGKALREEEDSISNTMDRQRINM